MKVTTDPTCRLLMFDTRITGKPEVAGGGSEMVCVELTELPVVKPAVVAEGSAPGLMSDFATAPTPPMRKRTPTPRPALSKFLRESSESFGFCS